MLCCNWKITVHPIKKTNVFAMLDMKRVKNFAHVCILRRNREISSLNIHKIYFFQNNILGHSIHFQGVALEKVAKAAQHFRVFYLWSI